MKDIRKGNDITVKWTVTAGSPIDLEEVELNLFDQYGDKAIINDVEVTVTGENVYLYQFKFYGKDQKRTGIYRVLLQRNVDEIGMVTLDKTSAFHLFGVCDFGIVRGEDEDHVETVVVELESTISTSVEGEGFDPELYYTKDETNALLAERQRAFTSQDPLEMRNNILRLKMLAIGNDVRGFVGTQVFPEVSTEKDVIMPSIKAIEDHIVEPLQTAIGGKQDTIQDLDEIRAGAEDGATAYQKPASGIPATDMTTAVQTSLGLADTAYQKPSGGIPATDMTTAVQQKLVKADSALQDAPIDNKQYGRLNGAWSEVSIPIDNTPVSGGTNAISSGGVYSALQGVGNMVISAQSGTILPAAMNTYYTYSSAVTSLAITLPSISSATAVSGFVVNMTTGNSISLTVTAAGGESIKMYSGLSIEANKKYELNFIWNSSEWIVAYGEVVAWGS